MISLRRGYLPTYKSLRRSDNNGVRFRVGLTSHIDLFTRLFFRLTPRRLHAVYEMWPIATDVASKRGLRVCVSVCVHCLDHTDALCQTD